MKGVQKQGVSLTQDESVKAGGGESSKERGVIIGFQARISDVNYARDSRQNNGEGKEN